jgi:AcrR family transcriptional regulator
MTPSDTVDLRERILREATRLFVARGYHGLSMREIAEAVGVSKAGLYYHFKDKEDLFLAILTDNLERMEREIQTDGQAGTTRARVRALTEAIFRQAPEQRAIIRLASQEMGHLSQAARIRFNEVYHQKFIGRVQAILAEGIASGELRPMDPSQATWILLGMMYPFFYPAHSSELGPPEDAIDLMLAIFFDGAGQT